MTKHWKAAQVAALCGALCIGTCTAADAPRPLSERAVDLTGISVAFGPAGGAEDLVIRALSTAKRSIRLCGHEFRSARIAKTLAEARVNKHIDIAVVVDSKANDQEDSTGKSKVTLNQLAEAKVPVRLVRAFEQTRGSFVIVDDETILTGSLEFSDTGRRNSSDVIVLWNRPDVAGQYARHWRSIWQQGTAYQVKR